jgi:hypothetical protein
MIFRILSFFSKSLLACSSLLFIGPAKPASTANDVDAVEAPKEGEEEGDEEEEEDEEEEAEGEDPEMTEVLLSFPRQVERDDAPKKED